MLSRSYRSTEPFDRAVAQLREHFRLMLGYSKKNGRSEFRHYALSTLQFQIRSSSVAIQRSIRH